jgi:hypothetical protein
VLDLCWTGVDPARVLAVCFDSAPSLPLHRNIRLERFNRGDPRHPGKWPLASQIGCGTLKTSWPHGEPASGGRKDRRS